MHASTPAHRHTQHMQAQHTRAHAFAHARHADQAHPCARTHRHAQQAQAAQATAPPGLLLYPGSGPEHKCTQIGRRHLREHSLTSGRLKHAPTPSQTHISAGTRTWQDRHTHSVQQRDTAEETCNREHGMHYTQQEPQTHTFKCRASPSISALAVGARSCGPGDRGEATPP